MKNKINVTAENIFPIIKKFLYSDNEIFLRELVSNSVDASIKLKTLIKLGELKYEIDIKKIIIEIKIDKNNKTIHVIDHGIGMTYKEVEKYINQIAFSGAEEFVEKYKNKIDNKSMIGHFGLGFYSAFMVSDKVEIITKSYLENSKGVHWICNGTPEFSIETIEKKYIGTEVILKINEENKEFLEDYKIKQLLNKYCKFMPIPIKFGLIEDHEKSSKDSKVFIDNIINNTKPAWIKKPSELKDKDYIDFYKELYPMQFENPLFWIHLNIDYPFNLTGVLFFPKIKNQVEIQKDKIQLYQNQVFVTDNLEGIVPDFLIMLRGVIDSSDIPLNVSRSYLQTDSSVKKITKYITRKIGDKLESIFKHDRKSFEKKWDNIKTIVKYGLLSDEDFFNRVNNFILYKTIEKDYFTFNELTDIISNNQKDKDGKIIYIYTSNVDKEDIYIQLANNKGYKIIILDSPLDSHFIQKIESKNNNINFLRVDSDHIENLVKKENNKSSSFSEENKKILKNFIEAELKENKFNFNINLENNLENNSLPFMLTIPEFMRRIKEMSFNSNGFNDLSKNTYESYNLIVNLNHKLIAKIININNDDKKKKIIKYSIKLSLLLQNLLKGKDLTDFINYNFNKLYDE